MSSWLKNHSEYIFLFLIVLVGAALRFHHLGDTSLSNDELSALSRTRFDNFHDLIMKGVAVDGHPAGVQVFLFYWIKIFGISEFALRFPFAVVGILAIIFAYLVAKQWFGKFTALATAAGVAFLQFPLLYSQIERPYASGLFLTLVTVFFWNRILFEKKNTWWNYLGFVVFSSLSMYNHYFSFQMVGVVGLSGLFFLSRGNFKQYLLSGILIIALFIPHISVTYSQLTNLGGLDWLPAPGKDFLGKFIYYIFNESEWVFYTFWGIIAISFWKGRKDIGWTKFHTLSILFFILPFLVGYLKSIYSKPVLQYSTLIFSFPFLLMFGFSFLESINKKVVPLMVAGFSIICLSSTLLEKKYFETYHFGVFKELASSTMDWVDNYGNENIEKTINVNNPYYIHYYLDRYESPVSFSLYICDLPDSLKKLNSLLQGDKPYFIHGGWKDNLTHHLILEKYPVVVDGRDYVYSHITLYGKEDTLGFLKKYRFDYENPDTTGLWKNWEERSSIQAHAGNFSVAIHADNQYCATFGTTIGNLQASAGDTIFTSSWILAIDADNYANTVISLETQYGKSLWHGQPLKKYIKNPNRWTKVFWEFVLPDSISENDILKYYVWNPGGTFVFVDDMEVAIKR